MGFKLTSITDPKPHRKYNEDLIDSYQNVYWLLDGASIPSTLLKNQHIDTPWYVKTLNEGIKQAINQLNIPSLQEILSYAISTVRTELIKKNIIIHPGEIMTSSTVVLVRLLDDRVEYLVLGNSYFLISGDSSIKCITDTRLKNVAQDIRNEIQRTLLAGAGFQSNHLRNLKHQLVTSEMQTRNKPNGYWIASNNTEAAYNAIVGNLHLLPEQEYTLLLMSDGYARAVTSLELFDSWQEFVSFVQVKGLQNGLQLIREREMEDDKGQTFNRSSKHDDASALLINVST